ncbi:940_t:CDS:2 [Ambispora gerdemannii]|uniref:940_t:CDS:1 n=1 Tax=Ambispora gerdemannii TaxID=144530 RepID=A0A9N9BF95_9GLOM|nr:940_t:CDS:2 [Ambispora gerdemannii]
MATKTATSKTRKPKANNFVLVLEQFLEKHNLAADSTLEQLSEHAPELDALLPDWMARRCVKVALTRGTDNRRSFSKEKIEVLLPDKRKGKLTIEERAKYCAKDGDFVDIIANHWALGPKNKDENEIVAGASRQSTFRAKLAEGGVETAIIEAGKLRDPVYTESETRNAWPFNEFLKQEPYRTIPKNLRDYGSKHASRIHGGKNPTPQHLKLLSRIAMRQESDRLDAGDNYAIGDTGSEESSPEDEHNSEPESESMENDEISDIINIMELTDQKHSSDASKEQEVIRYTKILAQAFGLNEQNAEVYSALSSENRALKKQLEDYHFQHNTLEKRVKRLERDVKSLETELEVLDECKGFSYSSESSEESDSVKTIVIRENEAIPHKQRRKARPKKVK